MKAKKKVGRGIREVLLPLGRPDFQPRRCPRNTTRRWATLVPRPPPPPPAEETCYANTFENTVVWRSVFQKGKRCRGNSAGDGITTRRPCDGQSEKEWTTEIQSDGVNQRMEKKQAGRN
ncbi:hypothetical protein CEXT_530111 [Caerostris extrusa]|uniref:Uncharacterized protein n=1 Tax=Caerostris extrusa TaxID=172846 RepID=A0AAV4TH93_CAEEX|nr:hypothetical protein CEXT_530111 [Caerostris extrusa]